MTNSKKYKWAVQKPVADLEIMECPVYDSIKDFRRDPTGVYVLIRCKQDEGKIEVAICDKDHQILKVFKGAKSQDLYEGIFRYEKQEGLKWFEDKGHCAYLGKELKKAELALSSGQNNYLQE